MILDMVNLMDSTHKYGNNYSPCLLREIYIQNKKAVKTKTSKFDSQSNQFILVIAAGNNSVDVADTPGHQHKCSSDLFPFSNQPNVN